MNMPGRWSKGGCGDAQERGFCMAARGGRGGGGAQTAGAGGEGQIEISWK